MTTMILDGTTIAVGDWKNWANLSPRPVRCRVWLHGEEDGTYSASLPELPGVYSEGESIDDALLHVQDALAGALSVYAELKQPIPWQEASERPQGVIERWIVVNG